MIITCSLHVEMVCTLGEPLPCLLLCPLTDTMEDEYDRRIIWQIGRLLPVQVQVHSVDPDEFAP
jgi:hypothetical protein